MLRWLRRIGLVVLALLLLVVALGVVTRPGRAIFKTVFLVAQILPESPVKPLQWFSRQPTRTNITFPMYGSAGSADLYRIPGGGKRAGVVLFLGVNPAGRDDPRVVDLSQVLARAGFVVLVPWSDVMTQGRVDLNAPDELVAAFQYLSGLDSVDPHRVGLAGFCVGASMAAVAAEDPRISAQVAFVNFFGGYYDAQDYFAELASRTSFYNGVQQPWREGDLARTVFTTEVIALDSDMREQELLTRAAQDGHALTQQEAASLSATGATVYQLLQGVGLEQARRSVASLPASAQAELAGISPSTHIGDLKAKVLIMQDREDDAVPVEESQRLNDALQGRGDVTYTVFSFFQHVDPTRRVGFFTLLHESFKLSQHLYYVVREAT